MTDEPRPDATPEAVASAVIHPTGPAWYVKQAIQIARLDTEAIGQVSRDPAALIYGAVVFVIAVLVRSFFVPAASPVSPPVIAPVAAVGALVSSAISTALIHGAAKLLFGATGTVLGVLRVLWLGSIVQWLALIPVVGWIVGGVWSLLIMMVAFQEVDGIERLQALGLSLALGAVSAALSLALG